MELLQENERGANIASAKVMRITAAIFALVLILDIVGIFQVKLGVMIASYIIGTVLLFIPTLIVNVGKQSGAWVKYAIVICAALFTAVTIVTLSYHAVLLYVYPIAIASLYFSGRLNIFTSVVTVIGVSVGQILAFYGQYVTDDNFETIKKAVIFGIIPRAMVLIAISSIFTMLSKRTASMLGSLMGAEQQRIMREKSMEVSHKLLETVRELDGISASAAEANRSIADQSENVMRDSEENSSHIKSVEESMNSISASLRNLAQMSESIARLTERADGITADSGEKMSAASESMNEICSGTAESREIISKLSQQSKKIVEIAEVITDISMQTNILALNASVEAAHAGEQGRGFAVVAEEIKKLSEQTKSAASEIGGIITQVTSNISGAVTAMEKNELLTREGMENMEKMRLSSTQLTESNTEVSKHIADMNRVISEVYKSGENVLSRVESVSANISNNCGAVQNVAAAIEENSAGTENLGHMVKNIRTMAEELERLAQ